MDVQYDVSEVFGKQHFNYLNNLIELDNWAVQPMDFTPERLSWLWREMQKYRTLFNDFTTGSVDNFTSLIMLPDSFWLQVIDMEKNEILGIVYLTNMSDVISPAIHLIFFDRKLADKVELCKEIARYLFFRFPMHRMTATIPAIYHATIRLAKRIGFVEEGVMRESQLMGGKWVNEVVLGLLATEV